MVTFVFKAAKTGIQQVLLLRRHGSAVLKTQMGGVKTFFSLEHYDCLIECFVMSLKLQCVETRKQSVHQATITTDLLPLCTNGADICQSYGSNVSRTGWDWHETDLLPACQTYRIRYVKKKKAFCYSLTFLFLKTSIEYRYAHVQVSNILIHLDCGP